MPRRQTLEELAESLYDDPEIAAAVVEDADKNGNRLRILSGELTLPHAADAKRWHDRLHGREDMTPLERSQADALAALNARIDALESTPKPEVQ